MKCIERCLLMKPKEDSMVHSITKPQRSAFVRSSLLALLIALVAAFTLGSPLPAYAAVWSSSDQFGSWSNGGYTLNNDVWGGGAGPQTIWANSYSTWGVWTNQPNTNGVKSYPHAQKDIYRQLSSLQSVTSSFDVSVPGNGVYNTSYDIWCNGNSYEIMLWMNRAGGAWPLGSQQTTVWVGGYSWAVYSGSNGSNVVYSFVNQGSNTSGSVDILAVLNWLKNNGRFGDVTLSNVQFGYEITSTYNTGEELKTNYYSVSYY